MKTRKEIKSELRNASNELFLLIRYKISELKKENCDYRLIKILNIDIEEQLINQRYCNFLIQNKMYIK